MRTNHKDRSHAPLSPSASERWMTCPGSFVASHGVETFTSEAAKEGITAHEWAEKLRKACINKDPNLYAKKLLQLENQDEDMAYHVDNYIDFLDKIKTNFQSTKFDDYTEYLEKRIKFTENIWGTLDYACVRRKKSKCQAVIADFKYGRGVYVDVEENTQLIIYLLCLEEYVGVNFDKAWIYIYQPRIPKDEPYEVMELSKKDITEWRKVILDSEKICLDMKDEVIPAEYKAGDHCRFCPAKAIPWGDEVGCPTFKAYAQEGSLKILDDTQVPSLETVPIEALVNLHRRKKDIEHFLEDVDHALLMRGLKGEDIGDLKIVEGRSNRRWIEDEEEVASGLKKLGVQPWRKKLITIGQAEKLVDKKKINSLTTKPQGKLQLAGPEDSRPLAELGKDSLALLD